MSAEGAPPISIGMPVYNGERFIRTALDSLLAQTRGDFELLVSDNASEDATEEICREYAKADRRVSYSRNETNLGAARNFNRVFDLARGRYFVWASYDDWHGPEFLARTAEALDAEPSAVLAYPILVRVDEEDRPSESEDGIPDSIDAERPARRLHRYLWGWRKPWPVFGLTRADALRRTGLMRSQPGSDRLLLAELSLLGTMRLVPEPLFYKRTTRSVLRSPMRKTHAWWDSAYEGRLVLRSWGLLREYLRVVRGSPLGAAQKLALSGDVLGVFAVREGRALAGDARRALVAKIKRRSR